jgi:serine/threonine-protein kinase
MSLIGTSIGRIRITGELGRGGMGEVFVGVDETLKRQVALKAIRAERRLDSAARARFLREARTLSQLDHPGICRIYDYVEGDERDFLVLELIDGRTLTFDLIRELDHATKLRIAEQIARVLAVTHERGIVHRDLKPANVMLTPAGEVKVLDFGIAAAARHGQAAPSGDDRPAAARAWSAAQAGDVTATGMPIEMPSVDVHTVAGDSSGTPAYMSPEQARGEPATTASDMYSFGLLLQELFTGRPAQPEGLDILAMVERARGGERLPAADLDSDRRALIDRLTAAAPAARPTAVDAVERLERIRDKPRRRLRRLAAAGIALALLLAGVKYTVDLGIARAEAERRRGQAEDLINFMLGDLRQRLTPVGRLDVLDGVGAKALDYFESLPEAARTDDDRMRQSKALTQIAEVRISQGDTAGATAALEQAFVLADAAIGRHPGRAEWQASLAATRFWLGYIEWDQGNLEGALAQFREYERVAERLVALEPSNETWQDELAQARTNVGAVLKSQGEIDAAIDRFESAVALKQALAEAGPGDAVRQASLGNSLSWLGEAWLTKGDLGEAIAHYGAHAAIFQQLQGRDPANTDWRLRAAIAENKVGIMLRMTGDEAGALERQQAYERLARSLTLHDPANVDWKREHATAQMSLAYDLLRTGRSDEALAAVRESIETLEALVRSDPANVDWRRQLSNAHATAAEVLLERGDTAGALDAARRARAVLEEAPVDDRQAARRRAESHLVEARVEETMGRGDAAREAWSQALAILDPIAAGSTDPVLLWPLLQALIGLNRIEDARPILRTLTAQGFRSQDLADLCRRKQCPS